MISMLVQSQLLLWLLLLCSIGEQHFLALSTPIAAVGSTAGCPAGAPTIIHNSLQPLVLLPDKAYQFMAGRFVLDTTLVLEQGQSCCISGSSNGSRTVLLPPKPTAAAGNSTARRHLHFMLAGGRLMLRNLTVSGYSGGNSKGGGAS
jgi:hypothetical protein